ncbi:ribosome biogenesis protein ytm1 [Elasticomyces elasticus]|nr:ribosome biogenesis protein ytm1 [Elasticomyces elasticus]
MSRIASGSPTPTASASQVRIRLTAGSVDVQLPGDVGPILVSTALRRIQLSQLVNKLLDTEKPIPFEFLINGQFLRTSIDDFLSSRGISAETTLDVKYVRALIPPLHTTTFEHDDWVSSVDILSAASAEEKAIASGSYDGHLRIWSTSGNALATSPGVGEGGHANSIQATRWVSSTQLATSSSDRTLKIWNYDDTTLTPALELYGHTSSVDSVAVHGPSSRMLSASADGMLALWTTSKSDAPAAPAQLLPTAASNKRRKLSNSSRQVPQRGPLSMLSGHAQQASAVIFAPNDPTVAYSTSWDHSMKTWDLTTSACVDTRTTAQSLLTLCALPARNVLATGTSARHITLIDPRASATSFVAMTLRGHTNAVVALAASPEDDYSLVSGSHDGTCRIWDLRNTRASVASDGGGPVCESVYSFGRDGVQGSRVGGEGVKVFGVCWDADVGIVSCGEDKRVQINRSTP